MNKKELLHYASKINGVEYEDSTVLNQITTWDEIGLDSIKFIQLIVEIEKEIGIEINDSDLIYENISSIESFCSMINKYELELRDENQPIKKVVVCDCDNVLWQGIAGEDVLALNENAQKLHAEILALYERGVLICLCTSNTKSNINNAFESISSMILKNNFFILKKYEVSKKEDAILEFSTKLNLQLDSFVFIDDDLLITERVSFFLPSVDSLHINLNDDTQTGIIIKRLNSYFTEKSQLEFNRTELYRQQKEREKLNKRFDNIEDYNRYMQTSMEFAVSNISLINRVSELSERAHQFNLSDKHYTVQNLKKIYEDPDAKVFTLSAKDALGDLGLVCAAIVKKNVIEAFFLSCRAFNRKFEAYMISYIKRTMGSDLVGVFSFNEQNGRFANFYKENGVGLYNE